MNWQGNQRIMKKGIMKNKEEVDRGKEQTDEKNGLKENSEENSIKR